MDNATKTLIGLGLIPVFIVMFLGVIGLAYWFNLVFPIAVGILLGVG